MKKYFNEIFSETGKQEGSSKVPHCWFCGERMVQEKTDVKTRQNNKFLTLKDIICWKCPECNERVFDSQNSKKMANLLKREGVNLITFQNDIK
ncbi:MAG: YgiT-type zinc finger protein [bacterium]